MTCEEATAGEVGKPEGRQSGRLRGVGGEAARGPGGDGAAGWQGLPPFPQGSVCPAHLSAQLGRVLPSQRWPWKPGAQRQEEVPSLFTQVPPLRHGAGERRL